MPMPRLCARERAAAPRRPSGPPDGLRRAAERAPNHAIAMAATQRRLCERRRRTDENGWASDARSAALRTARGARMRETPSYGTRCSRRTSKRILRRWARPRRRERRRGPGARARAGARTRPTRRRCLPRGPTPVTSPGGAGGAGATRTLDLDKRQRDLRVPLLRRLQDEVVEGLPDLGVLAVVCAGVGGRRRAWVRGCVGACVRGDVHGRRPRATAHRRRESGRSCARGGGRA